MQYKGEKCEQFRKKGSGTFHQNSIKNKKYEEEGIFPNMIVKKFLELKMPIF